MENSLNQNKVWGWGELVGQLEKSGWHPGKKYLTPRQKDYIVGHLGEP